MKLSIKLPAGVRRPRVLSGWDFRGLIGLLVIALIVGGWFTHVIVSLKAATYMLLIVGCLFFPIGVIHGIGAWFGAW